VVEWWSWRLAILMICICVSLMLLACSSIASTPIVTPTEMAPITLTVWMASATPLLTPLVAITATPAPQTAHPEQTITYIVNPGDTLDEVARNFGIETELLQAANPQLGSGKALTTFDRLIIPYRPPTQTPQPLDVAAPECYLTLADEYLCLGSIRNRGADAVTRISIHFVLIAPDGSLLSETVAGVEQPRISPGQSAPYRALFSVETSRASLLVTTPLPSETDSAANLSAVLTPTDDTNAASSVLEQSRVVFNLRSADAVLPEVTSIPLTVEHQLIQAEDADTVRSAGLQIAIQLSNPNEILIPRLRMIACVFNTDDKLIGYRVIDSGPLQPGETRSLEVSVQPMTDDFTELTYTIYAEALMN
jgi:hypothetical protein